MLAAHLFFVVRQVEHEATLTVRGVTCFVAEEFDGR